MTTRSIRIGNGAGFWGDNLDAPRYLAESGELDYLSLEYLAELTLSILAHQRAKNPDRGFVTDLPDVVAAITPQLAADRPLKVVTNGGGVNPRGCAMATSKALVDSSLDNLRVAVVAGDDLLPRLDELIAAGESFSHFESDEPFEGLQDRLACANAYLGAEGIARALEQDAQIVITGRVVDAALVVGPALHEFGWSWHDWDRLGAATVVGHLIECGAQVTGGMYSDWDAKIDLATIGYPIAELREDGTAVISKPPATGGRVSIGTVSEQLVYEIGDPEKYITPDVIANFANVRLTEVKQDQVLVKGATGTAAPPTLKVSMAYYDGFATTGDIVVCGPQAPLKARVAADVIRSRMKSAGFALEHFEYECLGTGATLRGAAPEDNEVREVVLRVSARDPRREALERLTREIAPLVTSGPPGVTGYTGARPRVRPVLAYWPTTISRERVQATVEIRTAKEWLT
jgi:hypothetical protein